jgi:hypothetical protein
MKTNVAIELDDEARRKLLKAWGLSHSSGLLTRDLLKQRINAFITEELANKHSPACLKQGEAPQSEVSEDLGAAFTPEDIPLRPEKPVEAGVHGLRAVMLSVNNAIFAMCDASMKARLGQIKDAKHVLNTKQDVEALRERLVKAHDAM